MKIFVYWFLFFLFISGAYAITVDAVQILEVGDDGFVVGWETDEPTTGQILYGTSGRLGQSTSLSTDLENYHQVQVDGLIPGQVYFFRVTGSNSAGQSYSGVIGVVRTSDTTQTPTNSDDTSSTIEITGLSAHTAESGFDIIWSSDVPVTGQVQYGTSPSLGTTTLLEPSYLPFHRQRLRNIDFGTYYYRVVGTSEDGTTYQSVIQSFDFGVLNTDLVQSTTIRDRMDNSFRIDWKTSVPVTGQVEYGLTPDLGLRTILETSYLTWHVQKINNAVPGTTYYYRVVGEDEQGNSYASEIKSLTHPGEATDDSSQGNTGGDSGNQGSGNNDNSNNDGVSTDFGVEGWYLINTQTNQKVRALSSTDTIDISQINFPFTFAIETYGDVGSILFFEDGSYERTELYYPFGIEGDQSGSYNSWNPNPGTYTFEAKAFSGLSIYGIPYGIGREGVSRSLEITVLRSGNTGGSNNDNSGNDNGGSDQGSNGNSNGNTDDSGDQGSGNNDNSGNDNSGASFGIEGIYLLNANTDQKLFKIQNNQQIDLGSFSHPIAIIAEPFGNVESVLYFLNGNYDHTENTEPYSLTGHSGSLNIYPWDATAGTYTIRTVPYNQDSPKGSSTGAGTQGQVAQVSFTLTGTSPFTGGGTPPADDTPLSGAGCALIPTTNNPQQTYGIFESNLPAVNTLQAGTDLQPRMEPRPSGARLNVPEGFEVSIYTSQGIDRPRYLTTTPDGHLLVAESYIPRISLLKDLDGDGCAETRTTFADKNNGLFRPFGMLFHNGYFYVANTNNVRRFAYTTGQERLSGQGQYLLSLPGDGYNHHWTRSLATDGNRLYVGVGSFGNADAEPWPRGAVGSMNFDGSDWKPFADGLRNPTGLNFHPVTGELYANVIERDGLGPDMPPDFFTRIRSGEFFGWPYGYVSGNFVDTNFHNNPAKAATTTKWDVNIQAHSTPIGGEFYTGNNFPSKYKNGAFVTLRGSWNRAPSTGHKVIFVPFGSNNRPTGYYEDFITGFLIDPNGPRSWGRPTGITQMPDGSIVFSTDFVQNKLYRVRYVGDNGGSSNSGNQGSSGGSSSGGNSGSSGGSTGSSGSSTSFGISDFYLVNADTDQELRKITNGETIDLSQFTHQISIIAKDYGSVESVLYFIDGGYDHTENIAPYSLNGDTGITDILPWNPAAKTYTIRAVPHASDSVRGSPTGTGVKGVEKQIQVTFSGSLNTGSSSDSSGSSGGNSGGNSGGSSGGSTDSGSSYVPGGVGYTSVGNRYKDPFSVTGSAPSSTFTLTSASQLSNPANANRVAIVSNNINLGGATITPANNLWIRGNGGVISNGRLSGSAYTIDPSSRRRLFSGVTFPGLYQKPFYPEWYGAVANDAGSDNAAFKLAMDNARYVYLTNDGTYRFTGQVYMTRGGETVIEGNMAEIETHFSTKAYQINYQSSVGVARIHNLKFDGRNQLAWGIQSGTDIHIDNIRMNNIQSDTVGIGIAIYEFKQIDASIQNSEISGIRGVFDSTIGDTNGVTRAILYDRNYQGSKSTLTIKNNYLGDLRSQDADVIALREGTGNYNNPSEIIIDGNTIEYSNRRLVKAVIGNLKFYNNKLTALDRSQFSGTDAAGTLAVGYDGGDPQGFHVKGVEIVGNVFDNTGLYPAQDILAFQTTDNLLVADNTFINVDVRPRHGNRGTIVRDNTFINSWVSPYSNPNIQNMQIYDNDVTFTSNAPRSTNAFVRLSGTTNGVNIRDNTITIESGSPSSGAGVVSGSGSNVVTSNNVFG